MINRKRVAGMLVVLLVTLGAVLLSRNASAAAEGKLIGMVRLEGVPPRPRPIDTSNEPTCAQEHAGHPLMSEKVVVGANGGLANVVVYLSNGQIESAAGQGSPVEINQKGCQYIPHVVALYVGQTLRVVNGDPTAHNVHLLSANIPAWDRTQSAGDLPVELKFDHEEVVIPIKCNAHPWMRGYVAVVKGPHAVTNEDGSFTVNNIAPGSYTITAWHETYGTETQSVSVGAGKPATVSFNFKAQ
jgi:plastocyanin